MKIIRISSKGRKETREILMDQSMLISAALKSIGASITENLESWLQVARDAFLRRSEPLPIYDPRRFMANAEVIVATKIASMLRVRKQADLYTDSFAETFPRELPPAKAIGWLKKLSIVTREYWEAYLAQSQEAAFFITGVEQKETLRVIRDAVTDSLSRGLTLTQYESEIREKLQDLALTGGRLRNVWHSTVTNSYNNTRYEELEKPEIKAVLGWWLFDALVDGVVRPNHAALDNGIAPVDWPLWSRYKPMLGWNCRCQIISVTDGRAKKMLASGEAWDMRLGVPEGAGPDRGFVRMAA